MRDALRRLCTVLAVALGAGAVALLLSMAMHLTQRISPDWLPYRLAGGGFEKDIVQRIEAAEAQYKAPGLLDERHLCAAIGLSGMREAADLKAMTAHAGGRCRFIGLSGAGGAMDTLAEQTRRLLDGSLKPDVVIIGIGEFLLIKPLPPAPAPGDSSPWLEALQRGDIRMLAKTFKDGLWFIERRRDVNGAVEALLMGAKQKMLSLLGAQGAATNNPLLDPWREMIRMEVPEHPSATALRVGIAAYEARGAYRPQAYARDSVAEQTRALNGVIRNLRERGSKVSVAVMPERSELRSRIPQAGVQALRGALDEAFGAEAPAIIDLRAAVPDSGFTDLTHVNGEGRAIVSRILADRFVESLPARRPLMAGPAAAGR